MEVFEEKQFFNRWWLLMLILAVVLCIVGTAYYATTDAEEDTAVTASVISLIIVVPIVLGLLFIRLETKIDEQGISAEFKPFSFTKRNFKWEEISEVYVRRYNPITEYGGWGWRIAGRKKKSYNVYGNQGIQILTAEGKNFLLGTQRPEQAQAAITQFSKQTTSSNN